MIWSFNRAAAQVDIEVRRVYETPGYELVIDYPNGSETVERFSNPRRLVERTLDVQERLMRDGWIPCRPAPVAGTMRPPAPRPSGFKAIPHALTRIRKQVVRRFAASFGL